MADVYDPIEVLPASGLRAMHEDLFAEHLGYVMSHSEFYQRKFGGAAAKVRSLDQLADLPFTTKAEVRESLLARPPLGLHAAAPLESIVQIQSSSGTTGMPTFVGATSEDIATWNAMGARVFYANGFRPRDWVMHAYAMGRGFVGGLVNVEHLQHLGCCVIPLGAESGTERLLRAIEHLQPVAMCATPSMVSHLGTAAPEVLGKPARELSVRKISVGGEPGAGEPAIRAQMESLWAADVRDMMGGADFGSTYWAECDHKDGMHLCSQAALHVEIVAPETLETLPIEEGATGEVVYTTLARRATPLIRYRMGDLVTVTATGCDCGRTGYRIKAHGRTDDMLIVRGVNVFPAAIKEVVVGLRPRTTGYLKIDIDFPGHSTYEPLKLRVEVAGGDTEAFPNLAGEIQQAIRSALSVGTAVSLVAEGAIERPGTQKEKLVERIAA